MHKSIRFALFGKIILELQPGYGYTRDYNRLKLRGFRYPQFWDYNERKIRVERKINGYGKVEE